MRQAEVGAEVVEIVFPVRVPRERVFREVFSAVPVVGEHFKQRVVDQHPWVDRLRLLHVRRAHEGAAPDHYVVDEEVADGRRAAEEVMVHLQPHDLDGRDQHEGREDAGIVLRGVPGQTAGNDDIVRENFHLAFWEDGVGTVRARIFRDLQQRMHAVERLVLLGFNEMLSCQQIKIGDEMRLCLVGGTHEFWASPFLGSDKTGPAFAGPVFSCNVLRCRSCLPCR